MYLLTRVPGAACTTFVEKDERFLSFSEAVLNALRCSRRGKTGVSPAAASSPRQAGPSPCRRLPRLLSRGPGGHLSPADGVSLFVMGSRDWGGLQGPT